MHTNLPRSALLPLVAAALLALPATALAATRYATPNPAGGANCSVGNPCSLSTSINGAANGDTVVIDSGNYVVAGGTDIFASQSNLDIYGALGQPRPTITISPPSNVAGLTLNAGTRLAGVQLTVTSGAQAALDLTGGDTLEDSLVTMTTGDAVDILGATGGFTGGLVRDDVLRAGGFALSVEDVTGVYVRHVTAIGTGGGGRGLQVTNDSAMTTSVDAGDSIFQGAQFDISMANYAATTAASTLVSDYDDYNPAHVYNNPNFLSVFSAGPHDISAAPLFVSAIDAHEAAGSPTIDRGATFFNSGVHDLDGDPRLLGQAEDIGAYEFRSPPAVTTTPATAITLNGASIGGTVNAENESKVSWHIDYGPTTAYGSSTTVTPAVVGNATHAVAVTLAGLAAGTYHYRVVAVDSYGAVSDGNDVAFTTASPAKPGGTPPGGAGPGTGQRSPTVCRVPALKGLPLARARKALTKAHCKLGRVRRPKHARGLLVVERQSHRSGTKLAAGAHINVVLAKPPRKARRKR